jgi:hypothetical protein
MAFEPGVDPCRLEANRAASSDPCVVDVATLACSVDRVPTHAGVFRRLCTFNQVFMPNLLGTIGQQRNAGPDALMPRDAVANGEPHQQRSVSRERCRSTRRTDRSVM